MFDSRIDNIKVNAADCDYLSNKKPPFYCLNFTKTKSRNKENAASYALPKKNYLVLLHQKKRIWTLFN